MEISKEKIARHPQPTAINQQSGGRTLPAVPVFQKISDQVASASDYDYKNLEAGSAPATAFGSSDTEVTGNNYNKQLTPFQLKVESASSAVIQMARWQWSESTDSWKLISKDDGDDPPDFDGEVDGEIYDDTPKTSKTDKDDTFRGKRTFGDSNALAKARYNRNKKKDDFLKWKKGREAQHLIPASLAKKRAYLQSVIDHVENGMMLPAVFKPGNRKLTHRKPKHRDHPTYSRNVSNLMKNILDNTTLKPNKKTMFMVMRALRPVNKLYGSYKYIDEIKYADFKDSWNGIYPAHAI